ncbi:MAG: UDP-N-acetylmuramoyl-L-alanyl-D-glutamate--2,6-diaminopimelate ligase [Gammaproteobacteria bacterium]|nr:MAG: UDP-N-acetylmuramoyl-L-alanyl-D-glutamate--2,6-diaminopimelate ligase [Gammaproteobacteria bacterium]
MKTLSDLTSLPLPEALKSIAVRDVAIDSRSLTGGELFVALQGARLDGRKFIDQAIARDAAAVIAEGPESLECRDGTYVWQTPRARAYAGDITHTLYGSVTSGPLTVIGVTGTNGKTSVTHFIAQMLRRASRLAGVIGTVGQGVPGALQATLNTTPDVVSLHRMLAELSHQGLTDVAMEVSSHALDQQRTASVRFAAAVFTNITRDHLDYHGTFARYAAAKRKLFEQAPLDTAIINIADPVGAQWYGELKGAHPEQVISYGTPDSDVHACHLVRQPDGFQGELVIGGERAPFYLPLIGEFNVQNALAAAAYMASCGHGVKRVAEWMGALAAVPGRMQMLHQPDMPAVVIDYAHTPDALEQALSALRGHCNGRLWVVFGCGGERDRGKRPAMGRVAEEQADRVVLTDDNPRGESPQAILRDILGGMERPHRATCIQPREMAVRYCVERASPDDLILLAGKGHETYQEVAGQRFAFSDLDVARQALSARRSREAQQ